MTEFPRIIAPSILAADFGNLAAEVHRAVDEGANWLHLDIMDGHFVPNISFGPAIVETVRKETDIYLDVHLMLTHPQKYIEQFAKAGANNITVHTESDHDPFETLKEIKKLGCDCGIAINPDTPFSEAEPYLEMIDLLLIMTVHPGFGGQSFIHETMPKAKAAHEARVEKGLKYHLEVDGGIGASTFQTATSNGVNVLVAGTSCFKADDIGAAMDEMRK